MYDAVLSSPRGFTLLRAAGDLFADTLAPARPPYAPPVEVLTTADGYEVRVELPGVKKQDVAVKCRARTLTVEAGAPVSPAAKGAAAEPARRAGVRRRELQLPAAVEVADIRAEYRDGMLRITLPCAGQTQARAIPIQ